MSCICRIHCSKHVGSTCNRLTGAAGEMCAARATEGGVDAASGSETEGEEQQDCLADQAGAFSSTVEGKMFEYMQQLVDNAHGLQVEQAAQAQGRTGASLRAHINTFFTTNTEDGTRSKIRGCVRV